MEAQSNSNDRLLSLLAYPIWIVGIVILLSDSMKNNPVLRKHGVQGIALGIALTVIGIALSAISAGLGSCIVVPVTLGISIYYGWQAYNGKDVNIPVISDFCRNQKWI
jgi:uncharacterized protein